MAFGPRLDLRQSQSLVMTPQLRQAIKLLQYSNLEVASLRRGGAGTQPAARARRARRMRRCRSAPPRTRRAAGGGRWRRCRRLRGPRRLPTRPSRAARCRRVRRLRRRHRLRRLCRPRRRRRLRRRRGRGIEDIGDGPAQPARASGAAAPPRLRQTAADRLIGAALIAAARPCRPPADRRRTRSLAATSACRAGRVEAVRQAMLRFDPTGMFARDLRECLAVQLAERNRLDPAMQALLDNLDLLARRDMRAADGALRRGCRRSHGHDRGDPPPRPQAGRQISTRRRCGR